MTAGVVSLFHAVPLLSGPVASALVDRYGCRHCTIVGSIFACIGFLLSAACRRLELLYLTFGLVSGFGLSLCYVAAIVIVAYYFERRRSLATGISVCGSGVGTFVFAPLTQLLVDSYGWRWATTILAAIFLNMIVCGLMFRELEWTKRRRKRQRSRSEESAVNNRRGGRVRKISGGVGSLGSLSSASSSMPEIKEIKELLEKGDIRALFSQARRNAKLV